MPVIEKRAVVEEPEVRADLVVQRITGASRAVVRGMFDHGCVTVDGAVTDEAGQLVGAGASVVVRYEPQRRYKEKPRVRESAAFKVVHEDDDVLVVDKQPGWLTVPTDDGRKDKTLVEEVRKHFARGRKDAYVGLVHRLDRGTSGVMVVAKNDHAHQELSRQFADREVDKEYIALVWGVVQAGRRIDASIGRDPANRQKMSTRARRARHAVTRITKARHFKGVSLAHIAIATGRTHQIRVHLSAIGHPVVGDATYGGAHRRTLPNLRAVLRLERPFLHAARLAFTHPADGRRVEFESPLPPDLQAVLNDIAEREQRDDQEQWAARSPERALAEASGLPSTRSMSNV